MALDISKLTSVVNDYLYSISDVNKLLSGDTSSESSSGLSGIFQKYLNKALNDETASETVTDNDVATGLSTDSTTTDSTDPFSSLTLPDLTSGLSINTSSSTTSTVDAATSMANTIAGKVNLDNLSSEINAAFDGLDIQGEIQKSIASHNRLDEINTYNATRIASYKSSSANTSVFGDFRL